MVLAALLGGCTIPLPELSVLSVAPSLTVEESARLAATRPRTSPLPRDGRFSVPPPDPGILPPKAGDSVGMMFRITQELADASSAYYAKDYAKALRALEAAERTTDNELLRYVATRLRAQVLLVTGHTVEQREAVKVAMAREITLFGTNIDSLTRMAEERLWSHDLDASAAYYGRVLEFLGDWRLPTLFVFPPFNIKDAGQAWIAQTRAFTGMTGTKILQGDYAAAVDWGLAGEERFQAMIDLTENPLYGLFIKPTTGFYLAHGWHLTVLAGAIAGESGTVDAADPLFAKARDYFAAGQFVDGDLAVDSVRENVVVRTGLAPSGTERIGILGEPVAGAVDLSGLLEANPDRPTARESVALPIPAPRSVSMPAVGERSIYGFPVTAALSRAFTHYLTGRPARPWPPSTPRNRKRRAMGYAPGTSPTCGRRC